MKHEDCIFCKIIHGELPSAKVYEDEHVYAFLDISQVTKGHTLIISKTHTTDLFDTPPHVASELFARVPLVANALEKTYNPIGMNLINNNKAPAGQTVFHLHLHLIPRYKNDNFSYHWIPRNDEFSADDLQNMAKEINRSIDYKYVSQK